MIFIQRRDQAKDRHRKRPSVQAMLDARPAEYFCETCQRLLRRKELVFQARRYRCPACGGLVEKRLLQR